MTEISHGEGRGPMIDRDVRSPVAAPIRSARHRVDGVGWTGLVLGAALVATALVTGLIFTFSVAVMPNLADADDRTFVATVQRFNQNPVFPVSFTVAMVLAAVAAAAQRRHAPGVAVRWTIAGLVLFAIVLAVTFGLHVPLNDEIDRAGDPDRIADLAHVRDQFEGPWVAWKRRAHPALHCGGRRPRPRLVPARTQHRRTQASIERIDSGMAATTGSAHVAARHRSRPPLRARSEAAT